MNKEKQVKPDERVCGNCESLVWAVALGQGVRCARQENRTAGDKLLHVSPRHTCPLFERRSTK